MPYSNLTKRAYAAALRELLQETSFEKITVAQICGKFGSSRKSFYYHFKDKYDLVAWIFDENFISLFKKQPDTVTQWELFEILCNYLYEDRAFYQKVLQVEGQNSFSTHFEEFLSPLIEHRLQEILGQKELHPISVEFFMDGFICSIKRWLLKNDYIPADQFVSILKSMMESVATSYSQ